MPTQYRYMSWNIKQFGEKAEKDVLGETDVRTIAAIINGSGADAVGVMEVTLKTGMLGMLQVWSVLNAWVPAAQWQFTASSNDGATKADRNGFFWKESRIKFRGYYWTDTSSNGSPVTFYNRHPTIFRFLGADANQTSLNFLLLHAPSPSENGGAAAISAITDICQLNIVVSQAEPIIISGDFNIDYNSNPAPYAQLTALGYAMLFNGQRTSLSTGVDGTTGNYLASAYDNIFVGQKSNPAPVVKATSVWDFVQVMANTIPLPAYAACDAAQQQSWLNVLKVMRNRVSDHLPVVVDFEI